MKLTRDQEQMVLECLAKMQSLIYSPECAKIVQDIIDKDIVIFIGNTRAGKSTVVNHVIGNNLKAVKYKKNNYKIIKDCDEDDGPIIGLETTSETAIPSAWKSSRIKGLIVDAPGFDDNRGEAQDVANAFYIKEMIKNANSVKFVLISDTNDIIHDNPAQFIAFLDKIHSILPGYATSMMNGIIVVFNKDNEQTSKKEMTELLSKSIMKQEKLKINNRSLVHHLIQNPNYFVLCETPSSESEDCSKLFQNVDIAIEKVAEVIQKQQLSAVTPGISDRSKCFLLEAHAYFTEFKELDDVLERIEIEYIKSVIPSNINKVTETDELKRIKKKLIKEEEKLKSLLNSQTTVKESLSAIGENSVSIAELQEGGSIYMKLDFIKFVDEILNIEESNIFRVKVTTAISRMKDQVIASRINLQERMSEITTNEANKLLNEVKEKQMRDQIEFLEKINVMQQKQIEMMEQLRAQQSKSSSCVIQ